MSRSPSSGLLHRLTRNRLAIAAALFLVVLGVMAIAAPLVTFHDPNVGSGLSSAYLGPSADHWFGTDAQGRDIYSRIVYGARIALVSGLEAVSIGVLIGLPVGLLIGYRGGKIDGIAMRFVEAVVAIPAVVLAMAIIAVLGSGIARAMVAVGFVFAMSIIRLTRATVIAERNQVYVAAATTTGALSGRVMWRHILPNVAPVLIVQVTLLFAASVVFEAGLSLIGLGASSDQPSWGVMLRTASQSLTRDPTQPIAPALAIFLTVLAINALGDGMRDAFGRTPPQAAFSGGAIQRTEHGAALRGVTVGRTDVRDAPAGAAAPLDADGHTPTLVVEDLEVRFPGADGASHPVVDGISFSVADGEVFALVGESGSGKTMSALAVMGLVPPPGFVTADRISLGGQELTGLGFDALRTFRGPEVAMIFQEPSAALNPVFTIGDQLTEGMRVHLGLSRRAARDRAVELLDLVGIRDPRDRLDDYPHQFSGGMAQRVMIAMALSCSPRLIIADEPTTALDVTVQGQVLDLIGDLQQEFGMAMLLITHDLGVVADIADRVAVMYAGQIVEQGAVARVLAEPDHPYTSGLLAAAPLNEYRSGRLPTLPGVVPRPAEWGDTCRFEPRCDRAAGDCRTTRVELVPSERGVAGSVRCLHPLHDAYSVEAPAEAVQ